MNPLFGVPEARAWGGMEAWVAVYPKGNTGFPRFSRRCALALANKPLLQYLIHVIPKKGVENRGLTTAPSPR